MFWAPKMEPKWHRKSLKRKFHKTAVDRATKQHKKDATEHALTTLSLQKVLKTEGKPMVFACCTFWREVLACTSKPLKTLSNMVPDIDPKQQKRVS